MAATIDQRWFAASVSNIVSVPLTNVPQGDQLILIAHAPNGTATNSVSAVAVTGATGTGSFLQRIVGSNSLTEYWSLGSHSGADNCTCKVTFGANAKNVNATVFAFGGVGV